MDRCYYRNYNMLLRLLLLLVLQQQYCFLLVESSTASASVAAAAAAATAVSTSAVTATTNHKIIDMIKTGVAGGVAGAVGTAILYPLDSAKTIRQASPNKYPSVRIALQSLIQEKSIFIGLPTAIIGAIPSSALYFGAYETAKRIIASKTAKNKDMSLTKRLLLHASAAGTGNIVSSAIFVPKEVIKQTMQYRHDAASSTVMVVVRDIIQQNGIAGLYAGYFATLLRNVPSAALRFGIYEELKRYFTLTTPPLTENDGGKRVFDWKLFLAGAVSGAIASGVMTPFDVLKTRVSTGTCPVDLPGCVQIVIRENGVPALWAGAGSRMISSALFSAIGFGTFEIVKSLLHVQDFTKSQTRATTTIIKQEEIIPITPSTQQSIEILQDDSTTNTQESLTTTKPVALSIKMKDRISLGTTTTTASTALSSSSYKSKLKLSSNTVPVPSFVGTARQSLLIYQTKC